MSSAGRAFGPFGSTEVAEQYRRSLEPVLFEPWAERLVAWAEVRPGDVVLDLAAGTGAVARAAARATGSAGRVIANDISPNMLDFVARGRQPRAAVISTLLGPAADLELPDASVDVVLCQHGITFMPDPVAALREAVRVLRPGGVLALSVWASGRLEPFDSYADVVSELIRPVNNASVKMSVGGVLDALHGAGLHDVAVTRRSLSVRWPSLDIAVAGIFATPFAHLIDGLDVADRERVLARVRTRLAEQFAQQGSNDTTAVFGRGVRA